MLDRRPVRICAKFRREQGDSYCSGGEGEPWAVAFPPQAEVMAQLRIGKQRSPALQSRPQPVSASHAGRALVPVWRKRLQAQEADLKEYLWTMLARCNQPPCCHYRAHTAKPKSG